jgi:hypothetical protein
MQTRESTMSDNDLELPEINLEPLPNFRAKELTVEPPLIRSRHRAMIKFQASDTWAAGRGPVEVTFGFRNPLTGNQSSRSFAIPDLLKPQTISGPVDTGLEPVEAFAIVNSDKEWETLDLAASQVSVPVPLLLDSQEWQDPRKPNSIAPTLGLASVRGLRLLPGQGLAIDPTAALDRVEVLPIPSHALSMAARPGGPPDDVFGSATWRFMDNTYQAASVSTPSDLALQIPIPEGGDFPVTGTLYLEMALKMLPGKTHRFEISPGPDLPFVPMTVPPDSNREAQWVHVGYAPLTSGVLQLRVRPQAGGECAFGRIAFGIPRGIARSPWLELPPDWKDGVLHFTPRWIMPSQTSYTSPTISVRSATLSANPNLPLEPGPWISQSLDPHAPIQVPCSELTAAVQWRLSLPTLPRELPPSAKPQPRQPLLDASNTAILVDLHATHVHGRANSAPPTSQGRP